MKDDLVINSRLAIPGDEIRITASRSSGPGGQHVNTADTRIELRWNVRSSAVLSERQRARIERLLASRINRRGELVLRSSSQRSQHQNRREALARLAALVMRALTPRKRRLPTAPTRAAREQRVQEKKRRTQVKQQRRRPEEDDSS